jgi:hypothetical protein
MIKDSTTLHILVMLNQRFGPGEPIKEMAGLQKEFQLFAPRRQLRHAFSVLHIVPPDESERKRWFNFLEHLKTYESDLAGVNGHDRVVKAFQDDLESADPLPVFIQAHAAKDDNRVTVHTGQPIIFSVDKYLVISIPTTPGPQVRQEMRAALRAQHAAGAKAGRARAGGVKAAGAKPGRAKAGAAAKPAGGTKRGTRKGGGKGKG